MKQTRYNVFETNSSSTHSMVLCDVKLTGLKIVNHFLMLDGNIDEDGYNELDELE